MVPTRLTVGLLVFGLLLWLSGYVLPLPPLEHTKEQVQEVRWLVYGFYTGILLLLGLDGSSRGVAFSRSGCEYAANAPLCYRLARTMMSSS